MHQPALLTAVTAVLASLPSAQAGLYPKSSSVLQLDGKNYGSLIANSNYTSIVEFYAPWCGHCQNLKPAYQKAASKLEGYAKVAAIDCDDESNKAFCGSQGIQGFPTLKIVRPAMKGGSPVVEDYNGPRTATGIVETVLQKINNHVTKVTDDKLDKFMEGEKPKLILFTEKGTTSALLRSVAIAFLDVVSVGQVRNKEKGAVEKFGIEKFPSLVLIPGPGQDPVVYGGELNKKDITAFLSQVAEPNADPAPKKKKNTKANPTNGEKKKPAAEPEEAPEAQIPEETPVSAAPAVIPINAIADEAQLTKECLQKSAHTCVLAFVPADLASSEDATKAVDGLSQLSTKYMHAKRHVFPFFSLPADVAGTSALRESLELTSDVELIALNARRGWWRHYTGNDFSPEAIEAWIDALRLGEGEKKKLPAGVVKAEEVAKEDAKSEEPESETAEAVHGTGTEPEIETEAPEETVEQVEDLKEEKDEL